MARAHWIAGACAGAFAVTALVGAAQADKHKTEDSEHGEPKRIALDDVITAAVRRSPEMAIARADHTQGKNQIAAAEAVDQFHLIGRGYGQDTAYPRSLAGAGTALESRSISGELGLSRSVSTGGDIAVAVATSQVNYLYPSLMQNGQIAPQGTILAGGSITSLRLTASQPIARGVGESVARADQTLQRINGRSMTADSEEEAATLIRDLVFAYWELVYSTQALAVDREGEVLAAKQVAITQDVVRNGMQPPSAVKLAELQVSFRREAILRDESDQLDHSLALQRLAGLEVTDDPLVPTDEAIVPTEERPEAAVVAAALARGPGMAQKRLAQRGAEVVADVASNAALPRVDLSLSGELSGVGQGIGDAIGHIGDGQMYTVMGGVTVQWDLGGAARAAANRADANRARLDAERSELDRELQGAAISATRALVRARKRVELSQVAVDVAAEILRSELVAFSAGRSTNVLVFQREDDVAQAKVRLARAQVDAIEQDLVIDYLTGKLLERYKITVTESRGHS